MKIQKIYSSEDGERLYSVILTGDEYKIFSSDPDKELNKSLVKSGVAVTGIGSGVGALSGYLGKSSKVARNEALKKIKPLKKKEEYLIEDAKKVISDLSKNKDNREKIEKIEEKLEKDLKANNAKISKISKKASKVVKKNTLKGVGKGALYTGLGAAALGYGIKKITDKY